ncbi:uncharacterized protein LOC141646499 [Silene latifolia]|uniref:uncharacterized protein LOC141646499 n=1 Tax=Silene latifolia TaxID=37657 RepID=UPI003D771C78
MAHQKVIPEQQEGGGIFRDESGNFFANILFLGCGVCSSMKAELLDLLAGLERAKELRIRKFIIHMDNQSRLLKEDKLLEVGTRESFKLRVSYKATVAGISCYITVSSTSNYKRINTIRSCSNPPTNNSKNQTPSLLKFAVSGVTEILRIFSSGNNNGMDKVMTKEKEELSVSGVDDVLDILKSDYDNAYFVTGTFSSSIYAGDCLFEDPTIKFRGNIIL